MEESDGTIWTTETLSKTNAFDFVPAPVYFIIAGLFMQPVG